MKYRPIAPFILVRHFVRSVAINGFFGAIGGTTNHLWLSLQKHGLKGVVRFFFRNPPSVAQATTPPQEHPFDLVHGTDTGGTISGAYYSAISLSSIYTTGYVPTMPSALTQALSALPLRHQDFTFIDIGSGKGRALLIAAQFPFLRLLGVEISTELCEIARSNIARNPDLVPRVTIVNEDATRLVYPEGPLLLYLNNPFLAPILRRTLQNLERQLNLSPRPTYLLYEMNPRYARVFNAFPFLKELYEVTYPFSPEDVAFDPMVRTEETFTLYSADLLSR